MSDLEAQAQIMHKSNQMRDELMNLYAWEKDIKKKEAKRNTVPDDEAFDPSYPLRNQIQSSLTSNGSEPKPSTSGISTVKPSTSTSIAQEKPKKCLTIPNAIEKANEFKTRGNDHVKSREYQKAIHYYTEAIRLNGSEAVYYTNRSFCYLKLNKFTECINDCTKAIELDNKSVKAYYRRAQAQEQLKVNLESALKDCKTVLRIEPKNADVRNMLSRLEGLLNVHGKTATKQNLEVKSIAKQPTWISKFDGKDGFERIDFVSKAPHCRSKQPLKRISVVDQNVPTPVPMEIDSNRVGETISETIIDQTSTKCDASKKITTIIETKNSPALKKMPISPSTPQIIPVNLVIPKTSAQFYKIWTTIKDDEQKFMVMKGIYKADISKMLGAQFSLDILREFFTILKTHFIQQNLPIINILSGIIKNEQMTIISAMMNNEDLLAFTKLVEYMRNRGEDARKIDTIQKTFDNLISM